MGYGGTQVMTDYTKLSSPSPMTMLTLLKELFQRLLTGDHGVADLGKACQADTLSNHTLLCSHGFRVHLGPA